MMKIVYLRWLDAASNSGWQHAPSEATGLSEIHTIGYLIHEDSKHIEIAHSSFAEREEYNGIMSIPKSVILERRLVTLPK